MTSWLAPGRQRFMVRAIARDGRKAEDERRAGARKRRQPTKTLTPPGTYTTLQ